MNRAHADEINPLLPQTQCRQCGFDGCRPFADAVVVGNAPVTGCTPGGALIAERLRRVLCAPSNAIPASEWVVPAPAPVVARIRPDECIGCARCLEACPVDAIAGAPRFLHTILADACTGCGLCLPPCPVDCIELLPHPAHVRDWPDADSQTARAIVDAAAMPCTDCGACAAACPEGLAPVSLLSTVTALDFDAANGAGLASCTACGACSSVCPSRIPLAAYFSQAKSIAAAELRMREMTAQAVRRQARRAERISRQARRIELLADIDDLTPELAAAEVSAALARRHGRERPAESVA
jgi:RnfABCDGE-type electron transport complex B subunit